MMIRSLLPRIVRGAFVFELALVAAFTAPLYTITDLGVLPGRNISVGQAINNSGKVTGYSGSMPAGSLSRAFRYTDGAGMQDLGLLQTDHNQSLGYGINDGGQVTGESRGDSSVRAFRYTDGVGMQDLGVLPGGSLTAGTSINNSGQVTGYSYVGSNSRAFRYTDGFGMQDLGVLPGGTFSSGRAINDAGQVAGNSGPGLGRAFRYTDGIGMQDLGVLPGGVDSIAYGINNSGQVVGRSNDRPFRYTDGVGMQDLGLLPGALSGSAYGINEAGDVVGSSGGFASPFLYTDTLGLVALDTLLPPGSDWVLVEAFDINTRGQITGAGIFDGQGRAYLLTPTAIPEPGSATFVTIGLAAVTGLVHHRRRRQT
jgi:probable HAF family extracellular repeat protein